MRRKPKYPKLIVTNKYDGVNVKEIVAEGVCAKCLICKGFEGFEKMCLECNELKPQPFKKHPIANTECCADCVSSALKMIEGKWLCKGMGCLGSERKGTWKPSSCWSKANQKRGRKLGGNRPDTFCIDCTHPPCSQLNCRTCKICRETGCNERKCSDEPKALNVRQLMMLKGDMCNFKCERCEGTACNLCGRAMTKRQKERKREKSGVGGGTWLCAACST